MSDHSENILLIRRLRRGDVFSFNEIYHKYNRKIYIFSLSYLKNKEDAEGVLQEVFIKLWKKRSDLKEQDHFDSYLFTITLNAIRKRFRKLAREKKHLENYAKMHEGIKDQTNIDVDYNDLLELTTRTINKLPPRQKEVYLLSNEKGLTNLEISSELSISKKTVENHLHRAKIYLKRVIADDGIITILYFSLFIQ